MAEDKKLGVQVSETLAVEPAKLAIVDLSYNPSQSTSKITNKVLSLQITTCSESYTRREQDRCISTDANSRTSSDNV